MNTTHRQEAIAENKRLLAIIREYEDRLWQGRHYLMGVDPAEVTVEDALEAFGWTRDGMEVTQ